MCVAVVLCEVGSMSDPLNILNNKMSINHIQGRANKNWDIRTARSGNTNMMWKQHESKQ